MSVFLTRILPQDKITFFLAVFVWGSAVVLSVLHRVWRKKNSNQKLWRMLCCIPMAACAVHLIFFHFRGLWEFTLVFYGSIYFTALIMIFWQFLYRRKYSYCIVTVLVNIFAGLSVLAAVLIPAGSYPSLGNYTREDYTQAFLSTVERMEKEYVLSRWKEIDYEDLSEEILPMVEKAQKEQNGTDYYIALLTYCYYFYDGHVGALPLSEEGTASAEEAKKQLAGNDYGFSMVTLEDKTTIAVLVDEKSEAYQTGIHDGTVITKWNKIPIEQAREEVQCIYPEMMFPVAENEEYLKTIFLAGRGPEKIEVSFLDGEGKEQTQMLTSNGSYQKRLEQAAARFYHADGENAAEENFSCRMLNEDCGYLRITSELYETLGDTLASINGTYPEISELVNDRLEKLREEGMKKLIIDLRNNEGGLDEVSMEVASLFAEEDRFCYSIGEKRDGTYVPLDKRSYHGKGTWADIPVVVLVNAKCCSAGDSMAWYLSQLPNVTLMGITTSNGVDQNAGGMCIVSNGEFGVLYPVGLVLGEDEQPLIDTRADRISRVSLDEHIGLTKEAAMEIFLQDSDYELEYAVKYLEKSP